MSLPPASFPYPGLNLYGADLAPQGLLGGLAAGLLGAQRPPSFSPFAADPFSVLMAARLGQSLMPQAAGPAPQPAGPAVDVAALEAEAVNGFLQDAASAAIRKLFDYLERNSAKFPQLAQLPTALAQAAEAFKARNYSQALGLAFQAHRAIVLLRASVSDLPPIQS